MGVPKRKMSKMKKRQRKAANRYEGIQSIDCPSCGAPILPHRVCPACGNYNSKKVVTIKE